MMMLKLKAVSLLRAIVVAAVVAVPFSSVIQPQAAHAATDYYVDVVNGSDGNSGLSPGAAWKTINHAQSSISAGAVVHVAPGTYSESNLTISSTGTAANPIKFVSDTKWGAKIKNSYTGTITSSNWFVLKNNGDYVTIDGFDIEGSAGLCLGINNWGGNTKILNNHVHDIPANTCGSSGGAGIVNANYSKSNDDIIGNYVHDIGPWPTSVNTVQGIYHSNEGGHVMNNIAFHVSGYGLHLWHAATAVTVSNNTVFNNATGGIIFGAGDLPGGVIADNIVVTNNIVVNNSGYGIREYGYASPDQIGTNNVIYNNLLYGNGNSNAISTMKAQANNHVANNIVDDPDFVNYTGDETGNYHLLSTSPAINSGTSQGAPSYDYGNEHSRPVGGNYDIGAYEYAGSTTAGNLAAGKTFTGSTLTSAAAITDGITNDSSYPNGYGTVTGGAQSIQVDLGASYNLGSVKVWHYYPDGRTYHDVIVQLSNDASFASGVTTVFNNDTNNSAGQGTGTDAEYAETSAGKEITFTPVNARYVRLWTNGSTANTYGHYMEVQIFQSMATNVAAGKTFTGSTLTSAAAITDGITNDSSYPNGYGTVTGGAQSIQVDLGAVYHLSKVNVWHYYPDGRTYHDVIVQLSNDPTFAAGVTTVFNNDTNNSAGQGTGTDAEYAETSAGKEITFSPINARYVRLWTNGSTANTYGHYMEVQVWQTPPAAKTLTFWERDNNLYTTTGYWYKQALIDGTVVWEEDIADAGKTSGTWYQHSIDVTSMVSGKTSFSVSFRLIPKQVVSNFSANVFWDDIAINDVPITNQGFESGTTGWTYSETGPFTEGNSSTAHGGTSSFSTSYPSSTVSGSGYHSTISQTLTN